MRHYPECDSYECDGCPRESTCDIRDNVDTPDPVVNLIAGLRSDVSDLQARLSILQRQWDAFVASVVRAASEGDK